MSYGGYEYGGGFGDGGYGGGGGGFLGNDHVGQAHGGGGFQGGSPGAKVHSRDRQTVMPLTIRQVLSASQSEPDDVYRVDGADIHQIKLVAQIVDVEETATNYIYVVDDSTARTTVKMLANTDPSMYLQEQRAACTKGAYVRIIGQLRDWQGEKTFHAFDVRAIQDPNEITYHLLEAIFAHCFNTKGRPGKAKGGNRGMMQAGFGASLGAPLLGGNMGGMGGMMGADGLTPLQSEVLACFRDGVGDSGEHIKVVERRLASRVTPEQLRTAVEFLSQEGHLYTTSDEMHFKATS